MWCTAWSRERHPKDTLRMQKACRLHSSCCTACSSGPCPPQGAWDPPGAAWSGLEGDVTCSCQVSIR